MKGLMMALLGAVVAFGCFECASAEDEVPLSRSGMENIYICNGVAHRLHHADVQADDLVVNAMERSIPQVKDISADLRSLATQRVERMRSEAELRDFDTRFCERPVIGRII